jgi:hypothetical protein
MSAALTAEEWRHESMDRDTFFESGRRNDIEVLAEGSRLFVAAEHVFEAGNRHALAALALHGQPFGFTWDDVDAIERVVAGGELQGSLSPLSAVARQNDRLRWLIDRIAALLPPKEEG